MVDGREIQSGWQGDTGRMLGGYRADDKVIQGGCEGDTGRMLGGYMVGLEGYKEKLSSPKFKVDNQ